MEETEKQLIKTTFKKVDDYLSKMAFSMMLSSLGLFSVLVLQDYNYLNTALNHDNLLVMIFIVISFTVGIAISALIAEAKIKKMIR